VNLEDPFEIMKHYQAMEFAAPLPDEPLEPLLVETLPELLTDAEDSSDGGGDSGDDPLQPTDDDDDDTVSCGSCNLDDSGDEREHWER